SPAQSQQFTAPGEGSYEEHDEELFSIFTNQLQQQVTSLKAITAGIEVATDKSDRLSDCIKILEKLNASASYMGYEDIAEFYEGWIETLEAAAKSISRGKDVALSFMDFYFAELKQFFPELDLHAAVSDDEVTEPESPEPIKIQMPDTDDIEAALSASANIMHDDDLFSRLSSALDATIHQVSETEVETLNTVFDEMVSPKKEAKAIPEKAIAPAKPEPEPERRVPTGDRRLDERRKFEERRRSREGKDKKLKRSLRVDSEKIDILMNQVGELVVDRSYFVQLLNELGELQQHLKENQNLDQKEQKMLRTFNYRLGEAISGLGRTSNELQEGVMKMRMLPISQIFNRYPRLVHDLTHNSDKKVNLVVSGEETELDKMIVEELSDPLIHIIRNAVDHGIENMEDRKQVGKQPEATLALNAYQESNNIVIEVTDDGRGIDREKIKNKALEKGLFTADELERMSPSEVNRIILTAGFSTADKVSSTSGRGVGMDVVRKNIEKLNGSLEIETKPGIGTRMRVKIPLTLAIIHALMIRTGKDVFAIPLANVDETVRINTDEISTVEGVEVIYLRGQTLPVFRLSSLFSIQSDQNTERLYVVIVSSGG
ncbi:MAG: chemotaxis protein CheA, partial [Gammaproteobacteria bacterium]|nr:chemotaxis protein CheA [Gammaproteobacteria bacterium]